MSDVGIDPIEGACFARLGALAASATPAGPFRYVGRWVGEVREAGGAINLSREALARNPSLLWQLRRETTTHRRFLDGAKETRGTLRFHAWVMVADSRGPAPQVKGTVGAAGLAALVDQVVARLNNFAVEVSSAGALAWVYRLDYDGMETLGDATNAALVARLDFSATRSVPTVAITDPAQTLDALEGDINQVDPPMGDPADPENPTTELVAVPDPSP